MASNASLNGMLTESRSQNSSLVAQFTAALKYRDQAFEEKISVLKSVPSPPDVSKNGAPSFASITRVERTTNRSANRKDSRQKSKSAARIYLLFIY